MPTSNLNLGHHKEPIVEKQTILDCLTQIFRAIRAIYERLRKNLLNNNGMAINRLGIDFALYLLEYNVSQIDEICILTF